MYKYTFYLLSLLFLFFMLSCGISEISERTSEKVPVSQKPGDCLACHKEKEVLPVDHADTSDMTGNECDACHDDEVTSLKSKIPLSHNHQLEGITCNECHIETGDKKGADSKVCLNCHNDTTSLIDATGSLELNPHFSPHDGNTPDCNRCHHQHKYSENFCNQCHNAE